MSKRFKFSLETVLVERKKVEDARLRELTMAQRIVAGMKDELAALEKRLEEVIDESTELASVPVNTVGNFLACDSFIKGQKTRIGWKAREIDRAEKLTEKKRLEYVAARQKREALARLKERRLAEYKEALRKQELKELDDIYIMNGAYRRRAEEEEEAHA